MSVYNLIFKLTNDFMKNIFLLLLFAALGMTSCNYLDIVPDETANAEDAWKDQDAARRYLYSCYSYMPTPISGDASLDFMTGDEVVTAFEHETFANFPKGNFTAVNPVISYWNTLYNGIRQCYMLKDNLSKVPNNEAYYNDYIAQADFLIGYYHLLLMRCYGPVIVVRKVVDVNTEPTQYQSRETLDECVKFITGQMDLAAETLPVKRTNPQEVGLATSVAAKALKAYALMYYASPLFNGNEKLAAQLVNPDGTALLETAEDRSRWTAARDAYLEAITLAEQAGYRLFDMEAMKGKQMNNPYPKNEQIRLMRANEVTIVKYNPENIWTINKDEGPYGLQKKSMPFVETVCYNGVSPTLAMVSRFYTRNGLPYDVDPETKGQNGFDVVPMDESNNKVRFVYPDTVEAVVVEPGMKTSRMNLDREPRYYAWIAFQGSFYEVTNDSYKPGYSNGTGTAMQKYDNSQLVADFLPGGSTGVQPGNNYSPSGFLNKKGVHPDNNIAKNKATLYKYPFPLIRLAELYLGYAECCAEVGTAEDVNNAKQYLNRVRHRAGIPGVDESWNRVGGVKDAAHLRDIIRNERQVELYLECQNFWDMRRWLLAKDAFGIVPHGMNKDAQTIEDFSKDTELTTVIRSFTDAHWLLPIPATDINNNHNVIQNPGY